MDKVKKAISELSREEIETVLDLITAALYWSNDETGEGFWDPEKEWDSDTASTVAEVLPQGITEAVGSHD